ncbi:uncharacterized protein CCOS01_17064 [Colletotrichum costaricense]|uniref:Uncharacterized protein n=1 Tax=Colletotrichum costaricense TaxID=1209916 RepID=A0AAI9YEU2_9PEZI|nr:uncharacterized protein CCOS01_17064 [Colletotrichum costaricense]KAK1503165.1 hypothetical protein CCOS01_17064 [Colletotrichum costaricense]
MKPYYPLFLAQAVCCATLQEQTTNLNDNALAKRASCNVCVTTVKASSTTIWGPFSIPFDQGGQTSRGVYVGCNVHIDRKRTTDCPQWRVWTSGSCGQVIKQQTC